MALPLAVPFRVRRAEPTDNNIHLCAMFSESPLGSQYFVRGLECSERHPRYAVSHDPHCRCPGLSIIARFIAAPWTTKRDHWRERERQIKPEQLVLTRIRHLAADAVIVMNIGGC